MENRLYNRVKSIGWEELLNSIDVYFRNSTNYYLISKILPKAEYGKTTAILKFSELYDQVDLSDLDNLINNELLTITNISKKNTPSENVATYSQVVDWYEKTGTLDPDSTGYFLLEYSKDELFHMYGQAVVSSVQKDINPIASINEKTQVEHIYEREGRALSLKLLEMNDSKPHYLILNNSTKGKNITIKGKSVRSYGVTLERLLYDLDYYYPGKAIHFRDTAKQFSTGYTVAMTDEDVYTRANNIRDLMDFVNNHVESGMGIYITIRDTPYAKKSPVDLDIEQKHLEEAIQEDQQAEKNRYRVEDLDLLEQYYLNNIFDNIDSNDRGTWFIDTYKKYNEVITKYNLQSQEEQLISQGKYKVIKNEKDNAVLVKYVDKNRDLADMFSTQNQYWYFTSSKVKIKLQYANGTAESTHYLKKEIEGYKQAGKKSYPVFIYANYQYMEQDHQVCVYDSTGQNLIDVHCVNAEQLKQVLEEVYGIGKVEVSILNTSENKQTLSKIDDNLTPLRIEENNNNSYLVDYYGLQINVK